MSNDTQTLTLVWPPHHRWTHAGERDYPDQDAAQVVEEWRP